MSISKSFEAFIKEAPELQKAWMEMVQGLDRASRLDPRTFGISFCLGGGMSGKWNSFSCKVFEKTRCDKRRDYQRNPCRSAGGWKPGNIKPADSYGSL